MAEKKASLTVLGGPLAGTRFVLEGVGADVLLGSDASCQFQLALAGVSAQHARIRAESEAAFTIEDAGSEHGLHVNDSRVAGPVPLRNGDIVWLGTPGEADVVMLQCILPARPAASPAPPAPEPSLSEDETLALALESETAPPRTEIIETEPSPTGFYTADEAATASGAPFAAEPDAADRAPFATAADHDLVAEVETTALADVETVAASVPFVVDTAPPPPSPPHFEDDTREQTYDFEGDPSTVVMGGPDVPASTPVYSTETGFVDEEAAAFVVASEPEPTVALEAPRLPAPEPPTEVMARAPRAAPPAAPSVPAAASPAPPRAAVATTPAAPRPPRPAPPSPAPAPAPSARRPVPRPQPPPRAEADDGAAPSRGARSTAPVALYAGLGVAALAAVGGGYWAFSKARGAPPPPTVVAAPPTTVAAARPAPPPPAATDTPVVEAPVEVQPEATLPSPAATLTSPTTVSTTTLRAAPSPLPSPSAPAKKGAPTPTPVATPAGPSPEQLRAQQVAVLLGQADAALASGQYDQAIGHFDEVLRLDAGNGKATADRASAVALRDASRKKFVAGRTVVKTEKAAAGGLAGFEGAEVQRTPDFSGRIEFEMSPASGLKTGDAWTMKFFLVNDGKKAIKIGGVTATTNVNGTGAGGPVAASAKEVPPQQRVQLGQLTGSWREGTTAWVADVLVTANKGDSLKNTLTWR